jgi:hypothetical protein
MKIKNWFKLVAFLAALSLAPHAFAQTAQASLTSTTLSAAITSSQNSFVVASATNITAQSASSPSLQTAIYVDHELMYVVGVNGTTVTVTRGYQTPAGPHLSGATVLAGRPQQFYNVDPPAQGSCTAATTQITPYVNVTTGAQWLCSTVTTNWVPGFNNPLASVATAGVTTAVATATALTPSGPLFHATGTTGITSIVAPLGFTGYGSFTMICDGICTWTTGTTIGATGTVTTAASMVTFTFDRATSKWYPSRVS